MKRCYNCYEYNDFYSDNDFLCKVCTDAGKIMKPVACHSLSDGPGSAVNEMVFEKPNAKKDIMLTAKKMEQDGTFQRNPQMKKLAEYKVAKAKAMPDTSGVDYSKQGYPGFDN